MTKEVSVIDLDEVVSRLESGETLTAIADSMKMARSTLCYRLDALGGSARVTAARTVAAAAYAEKAERVIKGAEDPFELAKAKELAHHYRWTAKCFNPGEFGDKVQADLNHSFTVSVNKIE